LIRLFFNCVIGISNSICCIETAISEICVSEIDLIAVNELKTRAEIIKVKRKADNINLERLKEKGYHFKRATGQLKNYQIIFRGLSMSDM